MNENRSACPGALSHVAVCIAVLISRRFAQAEERWGFTMRVSLGRRPKDGLLAGISVHVDPAVVSCRDGCSCDHSFRSQPPAGILVMPLGGGWTLLRSPHNTVSEPPFHSCSLLSPTHRARCRQQLDCAFLCLIGFRVCDRTAWRERDGVPSVRRDEDGRHLRWRTVAAPDSEGEQTSLLAGLAELCLIYEWSSRSDQDPHKCEN